MSENCYERYKTNIDLAAGDPGRLWAMWVARCQILDHTEEGIPDSYNVSPVLSAFKWAFRNYVDLALLPEFRAGEPVISDDSRCGVVVKCSPAYDSRSGGADDPVLDAVVVDFGDTKEICRCRFLKKAEIPKHVMDFMLKKLSSDTAKAEMRERVHEKVDEAFNEKRENP